MTNKVLSAEIYREEGEAFRSISLEVGPDGAKIDAQDMGPLVEQMWDHDDYEFWVTVPPGATPALLFALLRERFASRVDAVDALRAFCQEHGIKHKFDSWP